jgi:hypothetical protein
MKKEIRKMSGNILQVTTVSERWYVKEDEQGNPQFVPSVTWICEHYPKGVGFYKWLAQKGWDESEAIKVAAGDKGSKVHHAIGLLLDGKTVKMDSKITNSDCEQTELTLEEYQCLMSFCDWFSKMKPKTIEREFTVWSDEFNYAGTIDYICEIGGALYIIDFKTGQYIWASQELQISAYKRAYNAPQGSNVSLAILQLGYRANKAKYKFTEIKDKFNLFLSAREIWANETEGQVPLQKDYPTELKLGV